jgi:very-short-patch-repair endonuclease
MEEMNSLPFDAIPPCKDGFRKTLDFIRDSYAKYAEVGIRPSAYFIDWVPLFTPIESAAWGAIRYTGLPMLPQYPIGPYFADFADPDAKIVLECDGRQFHQDKDRDAARDRFMVARGWSVYRVTGRECMAEEIDWEAISYLRADHEPDEAGRIVMNWLLGSVEGVISAIGVAHYGKEIKSADPLIIEETLRRHASTGRPSSRDCLGFGGA